MAKKTGIIRSISRKQGGRNAFTMQGEKENGKDIWFSGYELAAEKGDTVEFDYSVNGNWHNFANLKVTAKAAVKQAGVSSEFRANVDAGNMVAIAKDLIVAGKVDEKATILTTTLEVCAAFKAAKNEMEKPIEQIAKEAVEHPEPDPDPNTEY